MAVKKKTRKKASALNDQQLAVTKWVEKEKGSLNLIARAGCGKTYTLIKGVVRTIVERGLGSVALMAFNKSAANEFKDKLALLSEATEDRRFTQVKYVAPGTVHSFGFAAVRYWSPKVKVTDDKTKTICEYLSEQENDVYNVELYAIAKLVSLAKQAAFGFFKEIDDIHDWFELAEYHGVNDLIDFPLADVVSASQTVLKRSIQNDKKAIDFDDMILAPLVHDLHLWPKDWVLIDEAQDTNPARRALAFKMIRPKTGRLIAVGDDRQAIYGFTGADHNSLDIIARELDSAVLPLTVTYRCPKAVVKEANRLVPDLEAHESAPAGTVRAISAVWVSEQQPGQPIWDGESKPWFLEEKPTVEDAVLCRNTRPLIECAYSMLRNGMGCRVEGREIGEGLIKLATRWKRIETLGHLGEKLDEYKEREIQKWTAKGKEERAQAAEDKVEALQVLIGALVERKLMRVEDLVQEIRGLFGDTKPGEKPRVVTLSTIHKAKGREWKRVYLLARAETLPSPWARKDWQKLQEENLEYVAITRAMEELVYVD